MKVSSVKVFGLVALGMVVGFVDGCGSGAAELGGDFPVVGGQQLVSMAYDSYDPADDCSKEPVLNKDGRYVVYASFASNLTEVNSTGHDSYNDAFRFDRLVGQNQLVSVRQDGVQANEEREDEELDLYGCCHRADISDDGKLVAFQSKASNLATLPGFYSYDYNNSCDVFVKNVLTGELECISLRAAIDWNTSVGASWPRISGNGRFVSFTSCYDFTLGQVIDEEYDSAYGEIWVFDRVAGTYELVSRTDDGTPIGHEFSEECTEADISGDGRYVVFRTEANVLAGVDTNGCSDVYRFDRQTGHLELVSVDADGLAAGESQDAKISDDGRYVTFRSSASNLVTSDEDSPDYDDNGYHDVFVRDMQTGQTICCSRGLGGVAAEGSNSGLSQRPSISADGRYIAFDSAAYNLVDDDTNGYRDVFVFDRLTGETRRVPNHPLPEDVQLGDTSLVGKDLAEASYTCQHHPSISGDGRFVSFMRGENESGGGGTSVIMVTPNPFLGGVSDGVTPLPLVGDGFPQEF